METGALAHGLRRALRMRECSTTKTLCILFLGTFVLGLSNALESNVTYALLPYVTSAFAAHSMMSTVQIVSNSSRTIVNPVAAKIADVFGRAETLALAILLTMIGYVCMGISGNVVVYCISQACYVAGSTASSITVTLIIADNSSLLNRVLLSCIPNIPYITSSFAGPPLAQAILDGPGWRVGILMWLAILPAAAALLFVALITLHLRSRRFRNHREEEEEKLIHTNWHKRLLSCLDRLDLVGLVLFGASLALTLIPFTLNTNNEANYFITAKFLAPLLCGLTLVIVFLVYDHRWAKYPIITMRLLRNPSIVAACGSGFFYFLTFYVFDLYVTSYYQVAKFASVSRANYINSIFNIVATCAGVCGGLLIRFVSTCIWPVKNQAVENTQTSYEDVDPENGEIRETRKRTTTGVDMSARKALRLLLMTGTSIFLIGVICFAITVKKDAPIGWMIAATIVISIGGGLYTTPLMSASQAVCVPEDLSAATALILTFTLLGGSVGSAVSGAIWTNELYRKLVQYLPEDYKYIANQISEDMSVALKYDRGTLVRQAVNQAYSETVYVLALIAIGSAVVVWLITWFIRPHKNVPN